MKIDRQEIVRIIKERVRLEHYRIFFFGSRANGTADSRSDIDIGIQGKDKISLAKMNEIRAHLEKLPLLQMIDFVDFTTMSDDIKKNALKNIEIIYEQ